MTRWTSNIPNFRPWLRPFGWTLLGLLWGTAILLILIDTNRSDEDWLNLAESNIQQDLSTCLNSYKDGNKKLPSYCQICKLTYSDKGNLASWTNKPLRPPLDAIKNISQLHLSEEFLFSQNRMYYQEWRQSGNEREVILAPVYVPYAIDNDFLIPYIFLGRYSNRFSPKDLKQVEPYGPLQGTYIRVRSPNENALTN